MTEGANNGRPSVLVYDHDQRCWYQTWRVLVSATDSQEAIDFIGIFADRDHALEAKLRVGSVRMSGSVNVNGSEDNYDTLWGTSK